MPTYERSPHFRRAWRKLSREQKRRFLSIRDRFVEGARTGRFDPGLRVKPVRSRPGIFEVTFAPDGRAFFGYGDPVREGERHVVWLDIGGHEILD